MRRRLFGVLSVLSLLLFVAVAVLWVRSYWANDFVHLYHWKIGLTSSCGHILYVEAYESGPVLRFRVQDGTFPPEDRAQIVPAGRGNWLWDYGSRRPVENGPGIARRSTPLQRLGFAAYRKDGSQRASGERSGRSYVTRDWTVELPWWALLLVTALIPIASWFSRWRRRRRTFARRRAQLCPACGYDWRATPGQCSECGQTVDGPAVSR